MSNSIIDSLDTLYKEGVLTLEDILKLLNVPTATKVNNNSTKEACTVDDTVQAGYKKCRGCGQVLPVEKFNKNNSRGDGLQFWCKDCQREYQKQRQQKINEKRENARLKEEENNKCDDLYIRIDSIDNEQLINSIKQILSKYKGEQTVYLCPEDSNKMYMWNTVKVDINCILIMELQALLGGDNVLVKDNNNKQKNTNQKNNNTDVSLVESSWKKVIQKIKEDKKLSIAALLREVSRFDVKDNILYLIFNDNFSFARSRLNSKETIDYIESIIREVTNRSFNIQIYLESEVANLHNQEEINIKQRRFKWQL